MRNHLKSVQHSVQKSVQQFHGVGKSVQHILRFSPTTVKVKYVSNSVLSALKCPKGGLRPLLDTCRTLKTLFKPFVKLDIVGKNATCAGHFFRHPGIAGHSSGHYFGHLFMISQNPTQGRLEWSITNLCCKRWFGCPWSWTAMRLHHCGSQNRCHTKGWRTVILRAAAVYTTRIPLEILDILGFPIEIGMGRFSGAVVVYRIPALKSTQQQQRQQQQMFQIMF